MLQLFEQSDIMYGLAIWHLI